MVRVELKGRREERGSARGERGERKGEGQSRVREKLGDTQRVECKCKGGAEGWGKGRGLGMGRRGHERAKEAAERLGWKGSQD